MAIVLVVLLALSACSHATLAQVSTPQTLSSPNAQSSGYFGDSIAQNGKLVVAGAAYETDSGLTEAGNAYVFNASTGALLFTLASPNPIAYGHFGWSVAVGGNYLAVGAYRETSHGLAGAGNAYVFSATTGSLLYTLTDPNLQAYGTFGESAAISGDYLIVGASSQNVTGDADAGHAYVFNASTGSLLYTLASPSAQKGGDFGYSVAASSNYAVVGAAYETASGDAEAGNAYVFNMTTGAPLFTLASPNVMADGEFGDSVGVSGTNVVVGAPFETASGHATAGNAYVFSAATGSLEYTLSDPNSQADGYFGISAAINGTSAVVGALGETVSGLKNAGNAYVFNSSSGSLLYTLTSPNAEVNGYFGSSGAASETSIVIGANGETAGGHAGAGQAYIYSTPSSSTSTSTSSTTTSSTTNSTSSATSSTNTTVTQTVTAPGTTTTTTETTTSTVTTSGPTTTVTQTSTVTDGGPTTTVVSTQTTGSAVPGLSGALLELLAPIAILFLVAILLVMLLASMAILTMVRGGRSRRNDPDQG